MFWNRKPSNADGTGCKGHEWAPFLSVQPITIAAGHLGGVVLQHTICLRHCKLCHSPQTVAMLGSWSLDQINGLSAAEVAESFLKS